jgi:AAA ATPase domain/Muconolactone delta-isomerase
MAAQRSQAFWGRTGECELLDRLLGKARDGQSAVLVIRGETGVGKTALLRYTAQIASGFGIVQIAGVEAEMELPFAALHQLCGPMLGQLTLLPRPQGDALRVALGLSFGGPPDRFLVSLGALSLLSEVAEERPLLCLVDDAQWLDIATLQVLGFVARRLRMRSIAIVLAAREPSDDRELVGLPELMLGGLAEEEAGRLLGSVLAGPLDEPVRDRIIAETRGNPLALLELAQGLSASRLAGGFALPGAGDVPRRIEDSYLGRIRKRATLPLTCDGAAMRPSSSGRKRRADDLGLYRAENQRDLETLLGALPLYEWMRVDVTPPEHHPNDPGGKT